MLRFSMHGKPENLSRQYAEQILLPEKTIVFEHVIKPVDLVMERNIQSQSASHVITAEIVRSSKSEEGVLYSNGQRFGGISFFIKDNRLQYVYNANKKAYFKAVSETELPLGQIQVGYSFIRGKDKAVVTLYINQTPTGAVEVTQFAYMIGFTATLKGNRYTPVTPDYELPFDFSGTINRIELHQFATNADPQEELRKLSSIE